MAVGDHAAAEAHATENAATDSNANYATVEVHESNTNTGMIAENESSTTTAPEENVENAAPIEVHAVNTNESSGTIAAEENVGVEASSNATAVDQQQLPTYGLL